jgi:hypothetical protein
VVCYRFALNNRIILQVMSMEVIMELYENFAKWNPSKSRLNNVLLYFRKLKIKFPVLQIMTKVSRRILCILVN